MPLSPAAVTITRDGDFLYGGNPVTEGELVSRLHTAVAANAEVSLVVTADEHAFHGTVVHVIDLAKVEGITKFAINVDRTK